MGDGAVRYVIRGATSADVEALLGLARELNTVNLPNDREHVKRLLALADKSFAGEVPPKQRKYVFLVWDTEADAAAGTSTIVAQLGRRGSPYIYFDVFGEEKYASSVDRQFHHQLLRIGFSYDGPTELGGLVVAPSYRGVKERLGILISYVRFLFIGAHRAAFRDTLLAELLPPLLPDGTSYLWEAVGRRFTDMSYAEADLLSSENKDFVRDLFPRDPIYVTLLSEEARNVIGRVGEQTRGVEKMLERVGFRYADRVDPFDGGPHFTAKTDDVPLVRGTETKQLFLDAGAPSDRAAFLLGRDQDGPPYFKAVRARAHVHGERIATTSEAMNAIGAAPGDSVYCMPLDGPKQ